MKVFINGLLSLCLCVLPIVHAKKMNCISGLGGVSINVPTIADALEISGKGKAPTGWLSLKNNKLNLEMELDLLSLDTENEFRNGHMFDYLKVADSDKNKKAKVKLENFTLPDISAAGGYPKEAVTFTAELTLAGVTKRVPMKTKLSLKDGKTVVDSEFDVVLEDFGIKQPSFAGITVAKKVTVKVNSFVKAEK